MKFYMRVFASVMIAQLSVPVLPMGAFQWNRVEGFGMGLTNASAQTSAADSDNRAAKYSPAACELLADELENKRLRLKENEEFLSQREERILTVQREIRGGIDKLETLRDEINRSLQQLDEEEEQRLSKLAKVYEATSAEEAGRLLSQLDIKLAARILYKMNNAKAGKLWAFVEPDKAVQISREMYKGVGRKRVQ